MGTFNLENWNLVHRDFSLFDIRTAAVFFTTLHISKKEKHSGNNIGKTVLFLIGKILILKTALKIYWKHSWLIYFYSQTIAN